VRIRAGLVLTGTVALLVALFATGVPVAQAVTETYRVQLDAKPPKEKRTNTNTPKSGIYYSRKPELWRDFLPVFRLCGF